MVIIKMVTVRMSDFPKVHVCLIAFISDVLSGKDILHFFKILYLSREKERERKQGISSSFAFTGWLCFHFSRNSRLLSTFVLES